MALPWCSLDTAQRYLFQNFQKLWNKGQDSSLHHHYRQETLRQDKWATVRTWEDIAWEYATHKLLFLIIHLKNLQFLQDKFTLPVCWQLEEEELLYQLWHLEAQDAGQCDLSFLGRQINQHQLEYKDCNLEQGTFAYLYTADHFAITSVTKKINW